MFSNYLKTFCRGKFRSCSVWNIGRGGGLTALASWFLSFSLFLSFLLYNDDDLLLEEYSESDEDLNQLEGEDGVFGFVVVDLWLQILRLTLEISFSVPFPLFGPPVKEFLSKDGVELWFGSVSWLLLIFSYATFFGHTLMWVKYKRGVEGLGFEVFVRGLGEFSIWSKCRFNEIKSIYTVAVIYSKDS